MYIYREKTKQKYKSQAGGRAAFSACKNSNSATSPQHYISSLLLVFPPSSWAVVLPPYFFPGSRARDPRESCPSLLCSRQVPVLFVFSIGDLPYPVSISSYAWNFCLHSLYFIFSFLFFLLPWAFCKMSNIYIFVIYI